jgi:hypothetical protein
MSSLKKLAGSKFGFRIAHCRLKNPKSQIRYPKFNCLESLLNFKPAALESGGKYPSCQICQAHLPHGRVGGDEENKKILVLKFERTSEKSKDNYPSWAHQIRI